MWAWRWLLSAALLTGCASSPTPPLSPQLAEPAPLQAGPGETLFAIDPAASRIRIHVFRAGRAQALGHNHVLGATRFDGQLVLGKPLAESRFALSFRLDELELDRPAWRAEAGPAFASEISAEAIAATRTNMLDSLQAAQFPLLRVRSLRLVGAAPLLAALVEIELHGQTHQQWLALKLGPQLQVSGALVLRQSDFGITPFSVGLGLLSVADEISVEFEISTGAGAARD
ncbi:MAG TPA: YceI family protein [Burkholderiaceae bacterium]